MEVVSVNISEEKGTIKSPVKEITLTSKGVKNDAHAGNWNRQVSLLSIESIQKFEKENTRKTLAGEFAENITTKGITLHLLQPLDKLIIGECEVEITQIGKQCHGTNCEIYKSTGDCVMPKEGIFARVIKGGNISTGVNIELKKRVINVLIITLSDRASEGIYKDKSGPVIRVEMEKYFAIKNRRYNIQTVIIPDSEEELKEQLQKYKQFDIIITTGSTGIGPRDIAPDVVKPFLDKEIPGIMDLIRLKYGSEKPGALISRSIAGVKEKTLIYTLPGSPKAVKEYTEEIFKTLQHCLYMLYSLDIH